MQRRRPRPCSCLPRSSECLFPHTSEVACEHFLSLLFLLSSLTRGCFGSSLCLCLCLCLCQLGLAGTGQSPRRDSQALCLTSSGQVLVFLCVPLVSQQHISRLFVCAMAAAGLGLRKSGKSTAKSSTQGWSPNSGQDAEHESASLVDVLVSEQGQHSSSSGLTLPQQQNQQVGSQTQSASSMDQLQNGLIQYQPSGTNPEPPTANALGQYQPARNNETPLAREDLNSDAIVNAQLTHLISRDDAPQGQDAPNASDVPMPDAPTVHEIATPRRTVGGRCRKWCISAESASGKRKCAACNLCGIRFTHGLSASTTVGQP